MTGFHDSSLGLTRPLEGCAVREADLVSEPQRKLDDGPRPSRRRPELEQRVLAFETLRADVECFKDIEIEHFGSTEVSDRAFEHLEELRRLVL